jgi:RNA polymerase sigma factor (sigma-70 family)
MQVTAPPFQTLLDRHAHEILGFLRAMVGPADAEDCFQETFLAALRAYPRLRRHDELRAWLFTIARNKATDHHRARRRQPLPVAEVPEPPVSADGPAGRVERAAVWELVAELPGKQRAAVALRYAGDLPYAELAVALDCSEEAARRSVHEGLKKLRLSSALLREGARAVREEER